MKLPLFTVAPEVVELFGGPNATRTVLADMPGRYRCSICGQGGRLTPGSPAPVIVLVNTDPAAGPAVIRLAHPGCSASGIVLTGDTVTPNDSFTVPAMAWLRPDSADPPALLVIAPHVTLRALTDGGEPVDRLLSGLLANGFTLLTDPLTPLPVSSLALAVQHGPDDRLTVTDPRGGYLFDGTVTAPDGWADAITATGRLGVVVVSGLDLDDPRHEGDRLTDVFTAIYEGQAVGAAIPTPPV